MAKIFPDVIALDDFRCVPDSWCVFVKLLSIVPQKQLTMAFITFIYIYTKIQANLALYCSKTAF